MGRVQTRGKGPECQRVRSDLGVPAQLPQHTLLCLSLPNTLCCCARVCALPHTHTPSSLRLQVCSRVFGASSGLVDMLVQHIPSSKVATANKVARLYTGPQDPSSPLIQFMNSCSRSGDGELLGGGGLLGEGGGGGEGGRGK